MKLLILSLLTGALASCSAHGLSKRRPGDPAVLEVTLERSVTKYH